MISQKGSKQVSMNSTVKRHENKSKKQIIIENNRKTKNNRKVKAMGKITPTMDHYPRNG